MLFFVGMLLLKPVLVFSYLFKNPVRNVVLELAENEEDRSSKETSSNTGDEFFNFVNFEWCSNFEIVALNNVIFISPDRDEHVSEIVPPPPRV